MTHCRGTLAHSAVRILTLLCCYFHRDLQFHSVHWTSRPSFYPSRTPSYRITVTGTVPRGLGSWLSPAYFQGPRPRWVSCYAFFKGWLLLSLPPHCLRTRTPFFLTFSQHLGTLTTVWVASLSASGAYPPGPVSKGLQR